MKRHEAQSNPVTLAEILQAWQKRVRSTHLPAWVLLPLRLFLGVTFVYAGLQKLTDPQYFQPSAVRYIGKQITAFAAGSPIHGFLLHVAAPHAVLFGGMVAYGELAIGLATLFGLLLRPAAFFGAVLSFIFFLSASWRIHPYFYGADIVFTFSWITLLLAGPESGGLPALDPLLAPRLLERVAADRRQQVERILTVALGVMPVPPVPPVAAPAPAGKSATVRKGAVQRRGRTYNRRGDIPRRDFLWGMAAGGAAMASLVWFWNAIHPAEASVGGPSTSGAGTGATSSGAGAAAGGATQTVAHTADVPANSASTFTLSNGDPGVVVHLQDGKFVAFDATCTHAGCPVQYDPNSQLLLCPCHGAAFDPAHSADVVQGPADYPLASVPVSVDNSTGAITVTG